MAEEEYQSVVSNEFRRLADYLLETPRASKEEVQKYHCSLKKKIDSGEIINLLTKVSPITLQLSPLPISQVYSKSPLCISFEETTLQ